MARIGKAQTQSAMRHGRLLMVTYGADGNSYALDNGVGVSGKIARDLVTANKLLAPMPSDLFLTPNNDGLFDGFTQTWRAI